MSGSDSLIAQQAARVVRAYDRFGTARAPKTQRERAGELEHEIRVLKGLLERKQHGANMRPGEQL